MTDLTKWLNQIHHIDALELLAQLPDESIDLIVTDPPYGINQDKGMLAGGGGIIPRNTNTVRSYSATWDNATPSQEIFNELLRVSRHALIFGGNYFSDKLPQSNHWVVWDKLVTMPSYSKCELIWTNFDSNTVQKITREMNGMIGGIRDRVHPTQKPVDLLVELICIYSKPNTIICDPFCGSGTTAIAARKTGRRFICGDITPEYVEIARKRLEDSDPFQPTKLDNGQTQLSLFSG